MIKREAEKTIKNINETFKVLLVAGPRQVGKTTLLKSIMPSDMTYLTLDDEILREQAKNEPKMFLEEHPGKLFIDEVQYAPKLFSYIKMKVDESDEMGQFWLTGSQQFHLMKNVSDSLAGRVGIINLNSFSYAELNDNSEKDIFLPYNFKKREYITINELFEKIYIGGMPEVNIRKNINRNIYFDSYIKTYIERDVKALTQVGDELTFRQFMIAVSSRNGEQLNYASLAKEVGISDVTVKKWLSILITSGIVYLLPPYKSSELKRITKTPKIIFMDSGLCAYLSNWNSKEELQLSTKAGHYLESFIISEIIKSYNSHGISPNIAYYRDKDKKEIDLIFYTGNKLYPFEIKKTSSPNKTMISNFEKLKDSNKIVCAGGIICCYDDLIHLDKDNYIIPISSVINN